ncbi:MAG: LptF/LptG family permease [Gammaproteobacteria bacterium]|nr:LptF/LptG family permease [Gammaproteobacteria bacterium]
MLSFSGPLQGSRPSEAKLVAQILSRYILRETLGTWLGVTTVLLVILLTNQVATVLARAAEQGFPRDVVLELVWFGAISNLSVLLPVGLLLGIMLAFGRLYHDSEMTAVLACGVDRWRIHAPVMLLAFVVATLVAWLTLVTAPAGVRALCRPVSLRRSPPASSAVSAAARRCSMRSRLPRTVPSKESSSSACVVIDTKSRWRSVRVTRSRPMAACTP